MSSYTCECGGTAAITEKCACEFEVVDQGLRVLPANGQFRLTAHMRKWFATRIRYVLLRLAATRAELVASQKAHTATIEELLPGLLDELRVESGKVAEMRDRESGIRRQLYAANCRRLEETKQALRRRDEVRVLRERLAEYERPVDDQKLAEIIAYVEAQHAMFAASERGEHPAGFAAWCEECSLFILAIRKLQAALRKGGDSDQAAPVETLAVAP